MFMSNLYIACELGAEKGRIMLGDLQKELSVSEAGEFGDVTILQPGAVEWNVTKIYEQIVQSVRSIVAQLEPVRGISFHSPLSDLLLFESDGTLITPALRGEETSGTAHFSKAFSKIPPETFYQETGMQPLEGGPLSQLAGESSRRLKRAGHVLSLADSYNYLFSGVAQAEMSQASQTQLYNPISKSWSEQLLATGGLPTKLLPPLIPAGTRLGPVREEVSRDTGLEDAQVIATCSHQTAAALAALRLADPGGWAFLWPNDKTLLGTVLEEPFINDVSREMRYSNLTGHGGSICFYKSWTGLRLVEQCHRAWAEQDRALDNEVLMHLATSAPPFEALIDPEDPRFANAGDMPQAIQAFCRETGQEAPRKPGPILRCLLESLALQYRKGILELEYITNNKFSRLYVLGDRSNQLLNHFLASALQIPVAVVSNNAAAVGNVAVQALTLGHIPSVHHARDLVKQCLKLHTINPHATAWTRAFERFLELRKT
jgi:rhamnulokinase